MKNFILKKIYFAFIFSGIVASTPLTSSETIQESQTYPKYIAFYNPQYNEETAFLGNFHPCSVSIFDLEFANAEGAFQAAKFFPDQEIMTNFISLDGDEAFRLARALTNNWDFTQKIDWQYRNMEVMYKVVLAKFSQNEELKVQLLATGNAYLVEHTPVKGRDSFWADDHDGSGQNHLGMILMHVRGELGGHGIRPCPDTIYELYSGFTV